MVRFLADGVRHRYVGGVENFCAFVKRVKEVCPICGSRLMLIEAYQARPPP